MTGTRSPMPERIDFRRSSPDKPLECQSRISMSTVERDSAFDIDKPSLNGMQTWLSRSMIPPTTKRCCGSD